MNYHSSSPQGNKWLVLLDAAAFIPTNRLDLSQVKPDFVSMSFYKVFGFPTGLGALLLRNENLGILNKLYWGGGTVSMASDKDHFCLFHVAFLACFHTGPSVQSLRRRNDQLPEHRVSEVRLRHAGGAGHRQHQQARVQSDAVPLRAAGRSAPQVADEEA